MAARLNKRHQDMVREKIRASQLINRLTNHVDGKVELSSTQVTAALGLLKKCVPDLKSVEMQMDAKHEVVDPITKEEAEQINEALDEQY